MAVTCTCEQCGMSFTTLPSRIKIGGGKYCSNECRFIAGRNRVECACCQCGKAFEVKKHRVSSARYCSRQCYRNSKPFKVECVCQQCGEEFTVNPFKILNGRKYCSRKCWAIGMSGEGNANWRGGWGHYRGPNWYQQRKLAYQRDQGICQYCGKKTRKGQRQNAVHHIRRFVDFNGDYIAANQLTNLITLCHQCHSPAEQGVIPIQPYLF